MSDRLYRELKQTRPLSSLEQEVFVALKIAAARITEPLTRHLRQEVGITPAQYNVLRILRGAGEEGLRCGEIGERMIDREPDVTRIVDRLVRDGLAERGRDESDRRVVRVRIGEAGARKLAATDATVNRLPGELIGPMGPEKLATLLALLEEVIDSASPTSEND